MRTFLAYRMHNEPKPHGKFEEITIDDLNPADVVVRVEYSSLNFKDALGPTGKGKIQRRFPIVVGIDLAGVVESSEHNDFHKGDIVFANGCDLGEKFDGGYAEYARVSAKTLMKLPDGLTTWEAMALGTAGFTAGLCRERMENNSQSPEKGAIIITGATGGVGSFAIQIFSQAGYTVEAVSGKKDQVEYLKKLGAHKILNPEELNIGTNPLERVRWAGAVDNVGGELLSAILRSIDLWGNIASVGLAASAELKTTVMPHILRGVSILGISSNNCSMELRKKIWQKLAKEWKPRDLSTIVTKTVPLREIEKSFQEILNRKVTGRIVVDCR